MSAIAETVGNSKNGMDHILHEILSFERVLKTMDKMFAHCEQQEQS